LVEHRNPPNGDQIASEIEAEMEARLYKLRYARLPPAEYYVYLHPEDYVQIEALKPRIVRDIQECLNKRVDRLNRRPWWRGFFRTQAPIEIPPGGWAVHIRAADPTSLEPGDLGIDSRLSLPPASEFDDSAATVRVTRTIVSGTGRTTVVVAETKELPARSESGLPTIAYHDDTGPHAFEIRQPSLTIGRGGPDHHVDLAIVTSLEVSREHCRITRDAEGRFYVLDLSSWGTFVNGQRVIEASEAGQAGTEIFNGTLVELGDRAVTLELRTT
jgi:hypothetical protein